MYFSFGGGTHGMRGFFIRKFYILAKGCTGTEHNIACSFSSTLLHIYIQGTFGLVNQ
jgi:hypothetical protein